MQKLKQFVIKHKIWSAVILIVIVSFCYYGISKYRNKANAATKYVVAETKKGTVISSVTGSGQVSASNQITLQSKASGNIIKINAKVGENLTAGQLIAQVDSRDAKINLENAQIAMEKLTKPADPTTLLQEQNSLTKSYETGFNSVASTFLDSPTVINGINDMLYTSSGYLSDQKTQNLSDTSKNYRNTAGVNYDRADKLYEKNLTLYQNTSRLSSKQDIETLISNTYETVKILASVLKDSKNAVEYIKNQEADKNQTDANSAESNLSTWTTQMNSHLADLLSAKNAIEENKSSLNKIQEGADPLDMRSQKLALQQKQNAYEDTFITAPFDGTLAQLTINLADQVNSGTNIGTFITQQKIADITVNEVDAAKIKTGQKATLTFDAIPDLSISGKVVEIDLVGTVSQGVVNYSVKIGFDTQDNRIKSGMSVSASIITDSKQDVLVVPNSALKLQGTNHYVEIVDKKTQVTNNQGTALSNVPAQQSVEIGLSDDTTTEILSGLSEGDKIITKTIAGTTAATTSVAPSLFGGGGRNSNSVIRTGGR